MYSNLILVWLIIFAITAVNAQIWPLRTTGTFLTNAPPVARRCVGTRTTPVDTLYNLTWNDGSYSELNVPQSIDYNYDIGIQGGSGTVTGGLFIGLSATLEFDLRDDSDGCRTGAGVANYAGDVTLTIGVANRRRRWRYCTGKSVISFCPPIQATTTVATKSIYAYFHRCVGSRQ